jgi:DmsE family decaheme c-type cytochrome
MHKSKAGNLLAAAQPALCYQCHAETRAQFSLPFHHKVNEGQMQCTDCHTPQDGLSRGNLNSSARQDAACAKCHTGTAGPIVYEHAAVKTEGCSACHLPHGGPHPRLLSRADVNTLCMQCHTPSPDFTTAGLPAAHRQETHQQTQSKACTDCHTSVHGSNTSAIFFKPTE